MKENDIVTIEDGKEYLLLSEIEIDENQKYFLATEVINKELDLKKSVFFRVGTDEEGDYLEDVVDPEEIRGLATILSTKELLEVSPEYAAEFKKILENIENGSE